MQAFKPTCTIKKSINEIPVNAMMNFLPMEEVKKSDHFILCNDYWKMNQVSNVAKVIQEVYKQQFGLTFLL